MRRSVKRLLALFLGQPGALDPAFYRDLHPDIRALDDPALHRHYRRHGRQEGRAGTEACLAARPDALARMLPPDFRAEEYLALHADVRAHCQGPAAAAIHYLRYGRREHRPYQPERRSYDEAVLHDLLHHIHDMPAVLVDPDCCKHRAAASPS